MVFQNQDSRSLPRMLKRMLAKDGEDGAGALHGTARCWGDSGRAYDIADALEGGFARERTSGLQQPLRRSISRLWKFSVSRSACGMHYRLLSDAGDFLMHAAVSKESRQVSFFTYDPEERRDVQLFDASRPALVLAFDERKTQWELFEESCEFCRLAPPVRRCGARRRLARVEHSQVAMGDATFRRMDVQLPGLGSSESERMKCAACVGEPPCQQRLATKMDEVGRLSSATRSEAFHSARNFHLATVQQPKHAVCQFVKIGTDAFGLDFRHPLSIAQAFGISMTTVFHS